MLRAVGDKVWVKLIKPPMEGEIEIFGTDPGKEQRWAEVLSVGSRCFSGVKPGDTVFIEGGFPHIEENSEVRIEEKTIEMVMEV